MGLRIIWTLPTSLMFSLFSFTASHIHWSSLRSLKAAKLFSISEPLHTVIMSLSSVQAYLFLTYQLLREIFSGLLKSVPCNSTSLIIYCYSKVILFVAHHNPLFNVSLTAPYLPAP